jgi:hypothetical protein
LRGIGEIAAGGDDHDHLFGDRLELRPEMAGALEAQDFLLGGFDPQVPEGRLVQRLHALAGDGDTDAADAQQGHGSQIDVASARDFSRRAQFAGAETLHAEGGLERPDPFGSGAATKPERDLLTLARPVGGRGGLRVAQETDHGALGTKLGQALEHARGVRGRPAARVILGVAEDDGLHCRLRNPHGFAHALLRRQHGNGKLRFGECDLPRQRIGRRVGSPLAPGMGDHRRPAPVEIGGRKAR